jgi:hypothetical protein
MWRRTGTNSKIFIHFLLEETKDKQTAISVFKYSIPLTKIWEQQLIFQVLL